MKKNNMIYCMDILYKDHVQLKLAYKWLVELDKYQNINYLLTNNVVTNIIIMTNLLILYKVK